MRRLADIVVDTLLRIVPWYNPRVIRARELRTERVHKRAIQSRLAAEQALGRRLEGERLGSYRRARLPR